LLLELREEPGSAEASAFESMGPGLTERVKVADGREKLGHGQNNGENGKRKSAQLQLMASGIVNKEIK